VEGVRKFFVLQNIQTGFGAFTQPSSYWVPAFFPWG